MITDQTYGAALSAQNCIAEMELLAPVVALCASLLLGDSQRAEVVVWILNQVESQIDALTDQATVDVNRLTQALKAELANQDLSAEIELDLKVS